MRDDTEVICDRAAECLPVSGQGCSEEPEDRVGEFAEVGVVAIVGDVLVHHAP